MFYLDTAPDCARCAALCCVVFAFDVSKEFVFAKAAGVSCRYLSHDFRCTIYQERATRGLGGCLSYGCFGAGQHATQRAKQEHLEEREVHQLFFVFRTLHEILWMLTEARGFCSSRMRPHLEENIQQIEATLCGDVQTLLAVNIDSHQKKSEKLLREMGREFVLPGRHWKLLV